MWFFIIWLGCGILASGLWWGSNRSEFKKPLFELRMDAYQMVVGLFVCGPFGLWMVISKPIGY